MDTNINAASNITITFVEVNKGEGGAYTLDAQWRTTYAPPAQENFWMWVMSNGELVANEAVQFTADCGTMTFTPNDIKQRYTFGVSESETEYRFDICNPVDLLFDTYTGLIGDFDGQQSIVKWDKHSRNIHFGESLTQVHPPIFEYPFVSEKVGRFVREYNFAVNPADYDEVSAVYVSLTPCIDTISRGPTVNSGLFFLATPKITRFDMLENGGAFKVIVYFTLPYEGEVWKKMIDDGEMMVQLAVITQDDEIVSERRAVKDCSLPLGGNVFEWVFSVNFQSVENSRLAIYLCTQTTRSSLRTADNTIALSRPVLEKPVATPAGVALKWTFPPTPGVMFTIADGTDSWETSWKEFLITDKTLTDINADYTVWAGIGPKSHPIGPFAVGFYPLAGGGMRFFDKGHNQQEPITMNIGDGFFAAPITSAIELQPLNISTEGIFTIEQNLPISREIVASWMTELFAKGMTPSGYYRMRGWLARLAAHSDGDRLFCYANMTADGRVAELFPGAILAIEPAHFQFQSSKDAEDNAGHAKGAPSRYHISLKEIESGTALSFDSFVDFIEPTWMPFMAEPGLTSRWAGTVDFFLETLRLPYACICYPLHFQLSTEQPTLSAGHNAVILFASTLAELREVAATVTITPTTPIRLPHIICHSRAAITLMHSVTVNGKPVRIPIGTTLGELLHPYERLFGDNGIRMRRYAAQGLAPVCLEWFESDKIGSIVMLDGDEVEY